MTSEAETILREALALEDDERAERAAQVLASVGPTVDDPATIDEVWAAELE